MVRRNRWGVKIGRRSPRQRGQYSTPKHKPRTEIDEEENDSDNSYDNAPEIVSNLVACWPNRAKEIAQSIGTTLKALQWFLGEKSSLDRSKRYSLLDMLGVEFDEYFGCYAARGPCVLVANKASALEDIYTNMTGGGDAWPCELVPSKGQTDPSWRYVLINPHSRPPSILMIARGDQIADRMDDLLLNFDGIRRVDPTLYRDVVSTCARACQSPRANDPR
ncbi:hypothetical protein LPJGGPFB_05292 [Ensifer adhaerens]|uniref:hypothetical protein n=1 Tax=Ensifer adhaerens TaxID=106592 RepID=UPI00156A17ED|nr:hypothetical protein [Ensifer adhaerens]NRP22033.1 hypothetical protein [Ensifer adhaerens]